MVSTGDVSESGIDKFKLWVLQDAIPPQDRACIL
jgi:hypothetical protein